MNRAYFYLDMKTHELTVPYTGKKRRVRVLLPKNYQKDSETSYPVVYFHDGQNVFYSKESFSGHSWKVIPAIKRNPDLAKMILVAIDNDGENRMNEYSAWKYKEIDVFGLQFGGKGVEYADFVMRVVKPFIDATYRTKKEAPYTAMIGSSLGGNITQFMGVEYQDEIGCLGVFSSANWLHQTEFDRYMEKKRLPKDQRVFIYVGTNEADDTDKTLLSGNIKQAYVDSSLRYYRQLLEAGVALSNIQLDIAVGASHNEEAWAGSILDVFRFFSEKW